MPEMLTENARLWYDREEPTDDDRLVSRGLNLRESSSEICDIVDEDIEELRESYKRDYGYDPAEVWDQADKRGARFKFSEVSRWVREGCGSGQRLSESTSEDQLGALVRFGVIRNSVEYYKLAKAVYRALAEMHTSNSMEETYDPLNRTEIPVEVGENETPPDSKLAGRAVVIRNRRFARMIGVSKQLYADDKTGQVRKRATEVGDGMVYAEDILWTTATIGAYAGTSNLIANGGVIPPTNVAGQATLDGQSTTYGPVNQQRLEDGYTAAAYISDLLGNFFVVNFDSLFIPKVWEITALKLLQSFLNPTNPGASPTAGSVTGLMAKNVMEGRLTIYASRFINRVRTGLDGSTPPWMLMERGKGFVFQRRTGMSMVMESPNVGKSLETNQYRYLTEARFGAGVVEPRFGYWGN